MSEQGYGRQIQEQIRNWSTDEPVTTAVVARSLAMAFDISMEAAKKITNVNMKRLADKGELARIQKGVYSKVKETPFGKLTPGSDEVLADLLMRDGDNIIGYIVGPTLLNALGICSWIPKERHIATNRYRRRLPKDTCICIYKPVLSVNGQNAPYLRALDALSAMEQYPVDVEHPYEILRSALRRDGIDNEKLIWYARNYYGQKTLLKTIDVVLDGIRNEIA